MASSPAAGLAFSLLEVRSIGKAAQLYTSLALSLALFVMICGNPGGVIMKNLFEPDATQEVISRIDQLQPTSLRRWGKMDVAQMMAHCSAAMDMASGRINPPRILIGRLIGAMVKPIYTNEKPLSKNSPTDKKLIISDQRDFLREQQQLKLKVQQFHEGGETQCTRHPHPFFGALTPQEWSRGMYKHLDHHLRQFGA